MKTRLMMRGTQMNTMAQVCDGTCGHDLRQRVKVGVIQEIQIHVTSAYQLCFVDLKKRRSCFERGKWKSFR